MRIRLAPKARADLDGIWLYIAQESGNHAVATRLVGSIADKFSLFSKFPHLGKRLESDQRPNVRTFPVNNYLIFYSVKSAEIRILLIIQGNRDAQAVFAEQ